jgi:hypothetical protein
MPRSIDTSELDALVADLQAAPFKVLAAIVPTAHRAGANIKRTMRRDATGHYRLGLLPGAVEYIVDLSATAVTVEVGFRKGSQGNLAHIAAFGTSTQPPVMDITRGLTEEVPNFMRWVAKVGAEALQ